MKTPRFVMIFVIGLISALVHAAPPKDGAGQIEEQVHPSLQLDQTQLRSEEPGRVAKSSVGEVGQRLTRQAAPAGIKPMARIASRIQSRVENRVRSRIDRSYNPGATTASAFSTAADQARIVRLP